MSFTTKYPNFIFSYFNIFLVPLANTISTEPSPESFPLWGLMFVQGGEDILKIYI